MQMQPWRPAIVASIILLTTACQTTSKPLPADGPDLIAKAVAEAKIEWCRGQKPQEFTPEEYNALSQWAQTYVTANMRQWQSAGCG